MFFYILIIYFYITSIIKYASSYPKNYKTATEIRNQMLSTIPIPSPYHRLTNTLPR